MHAHQSKAPRATLQHTHTYSTHSTAGTDQFIPQLLLQQQQIDMMEEKWKILRLFYPQSCRDMEWVGLVVVEEDTTINNNQQQQHH